MTNRSPVKRNLGGAALYLNVIMQLILDCELVSFDMAGDKVLAYVNRTAVPTHHSAEPVEFEILFRFLDGFGPRVPALLRSKYAAQA